MSCILCNVVLKGLCKCTYLAHFVLNRYVNEADFKSDIDGVGNPPREESIHMTGDVQGMHKDRHPVQVRDVLQINQMI